MWVVECVELLSKWVGAVLLGCGLVASSSDKSDRSSDIKDWLEGLLGIDMARGDDQSGSEVKGNGLSSVRQDDYLKCSYTQKV